MRKQLHEEFLNIVIELNKLHITPLLLGSLGLEQVTGKSWQASDIDIYLINEDVLDKQYDQIHKILIDSKYEKLNTEDMAYIKDDFKVEYKSFLDFQNLVKIDKEKFDLVKTEGARYFLPTKKQFFHIYRSAVDDKKRQHKNHKDVEKLNYLKEMGDNKK